MVMRIQDALVAVHADQQELEAAAGAAQLQEVVPRGGADGLHKGRWALP